MHAKNRLFKGFVIVLMVLIVLGGGLLVLRNLDLGAAGDAIDNGAQPTAAADDMDISMSSATGGSDDDAEDEAA